VINSDQEWIPVISILITIRDFTFDMLITGIHS